MLYFLHLKISLNFFFFNDIRMRLQGRDHIRQHRLLLHRYRGRRKYATGVSQASNKKKRVFNQYKSHRLEQKTFYTFTCCGLWIRICCFSVIFGCTVVLLVGAICNFWLFGTAAWNCKLEITPPSPLFTNVVRILMIAGLFRSRDGVRNMENPFFE